MNATACEGSPMNMQRFCCVILGRSPFLPVPLVTVAFPISAFAFDQAFSLMHLYLYHEYYVQNDCCKD